MTISSSFDTLVGNTASLQMALYSLNHDLLERSMICEPVNINGVESVKRCSKCGEFKIKSSFSPDKRAKDGLQSQCKGCKNRADNDARAKNPEKSREQARVRRLENLENARAKAREKYAENPEKFRELQKIRRRENPEKVREQERIRRARDPQKRSEQRRVADKILRDANPEKHRLRNRRSKKKNAHRVNAYTAERRALKLKATPPWVVGDFKKMSRNVYLDAMWITMLTGINHEVDHFHPLKGENFSGLHVPWNLRVIPALDNSLKSNKPPKEESDMFWNYTMKQLEVEYGT